MSDSVAAMNQAGARIVVLGSVNLDMVLRCARLPLPGETVCSSAHVRHVGGKGANQAVAARRLGGTVQFVGCVGDDLAGTQAMETLAAEGVDISGLRRVPGPTGLAVLMIEESGQNSIVLDAGANAALDGAQVEAAAPAIRGAQALVCQLETPLQPMLQAMAIARAAGVRVLLNPAPAQALSAECLQRVDVLVPNELEVLALARLGGHPAANPREAAVWLRSQGAQTIVVTLGEKGVLVADADGLRALPAPHVRALDTGGAGDTFVGALALSLCEGRPLDDAVAVAQAAAAISVTRHGTMDAMPSVAELRAALAAGGTTAGHGSP